MTDKYDKAIEYLTEHPEEIPHAWLAPSRHQAGCLFEFLGKDGECGCPAMIRNEEFISSSPEITAAIKSDESVPPPIARLITIVSLPRFAHYQRMFDATGLPR